MTTKTYRQKISKDLLSLLVSLLKLHCKDNQMNIESNKLSFKKIIFIILIILYLLENKNGGISVINFSRQIQPWLLLWVRWQTVSPLHLSIITTPGNPVRAGHVAQLNTACLPWVWSLDVINQEWWYMAVTGNWKQENQKVWGRLLLPIWATWNPV